MSSVVSICGILCAAVVLVSAQNNTLCLSYLHPCVEGSSNCCDYPAISCLPDKRNGTSCLSLLDVVNLNPMMTGLSALKPFLVNATGLFRETIDVNGRNVYNTTEHFTPRSTTNTKPVTLTPTIRHHETTQKPHENVTQHESTTHKSN